WLFTEAGTPTAENTDAGTLRASTTPAGASVSVELAVGLDDDPPTTFTSTRARMTTTTNPIGISTRVNGEPGGPWRPGPPRPPGGRPRGGAPRTPARPGGPGRRDEVPGLVCAISGEHPTGR